MIIFFRSLACMLLLLFTAAPVRASGICQEVGLGTPPNLSKIEFCLSKCADASAPASSCRGACLRSYCERAPSPPKPPQVPAAVASVAAPNCGDAGRVASADVGRANHCFFLCDGIKLPSGQQSCRRSCRDKYCLDSTADAASELEDIGCERTDANTITCGDGVYVRSQGVNEERIIKEVQRSSGTGGAGASGSKASGR